MQKVLTVLKIYRQQVSWYDILYSDCEWNKHDSFSKYFSKLSVC